LVGNVKYVRVTGTPLNATPHPPERRDDLTGQLAAIVGVGHLGSPQKFQVVAH